MDDYEYNPTEVAIFKFANGGIGTLFASFKLISPYIMNFAYHARLLCSSRLDVLPAHGAKRAASAFSTSCCVAGLMRPRRLTSRVLSTVRS